MRISSPARSLPGPRRRLAACLSVLGCVALAGCGAAGVARDEDSASGLAHPARASLTADTDARLSRAQCQTAGLQTLATIGERVYRQATAGRIVTAALQRAQRSRALTEALERNDAHAARAALQGLLANQVVRAQVRRGSRTLADAGPHAVLAPDTAALRDRYGRALGSVTVSVHGDRGFAATLHAITGAQVLIRGASHTTLSTLSGRALRSARAPGRRRTTGRVPDRGRVILGGIRYRAISFPAQAFPAGPLRVTMLVAASSLSCHGGSAAAIAAQTLGGVAQRLYREELTGGKTRATVAMVEHDRAFGAAVRRGDPVATRAAIVALFRSHLHVVRVRAFRGSQLVLDLGGPFVLAPATGAVRDSSGRTVGRFLLSIQDDLGYVLLTHGFTGAQVLLRAGPRQVMGTLSPGPTWIPSRGPVSYEGHRYQAFSFTGKAFPSGPLRISLLIPAD